MKHTQKDQALSSVIASLGDLKEEEPRTIRDVVEILGSASFMPLLLLVSLLVVTPISGIPGLSGTSGLIIAAVSGQLLVGRRVLWLPERILRMKVPRRRLGNALEMLESPLNYIQEITTRRLSFLAEGLFAEVLLILCFLCGLSMPFLEVVPMTSSILALAISFLVISVLSKDGLFAVLGLGTLIVAVSVFIVLAQAIFRAL